MLLPPSGIPISYFLCNQCGFCYAPEFFEWSLEDFEKKIYNEHYIEIDPEYLEARPRRNFLLLEELFGEEKNKIRHLDYGGGNGLLSKLLCEAGWNSTTYDPFVNRDINIDSLGKFDLISAIEVVEHVPNVEELISNLSTLLVEDGIILISTVVSDGSIEAGKRLSWWYAAPRNGHISLFTYESLKVLGKTKGFLFSSAGGSLHIFYRKIPDWAGQTFKENT
ncbi:MAG: class I SAM-dependent methyltransferase [Pseudomonadota bacterium]